MDPAKHAEPLRMVGEGLDLDFALHAVSFQRLADGDEHKHQHSAWSMAHSVKE
jgi:hypothetical protein